LETITQTQLSGYLFVLSGRSKNAHFKFFGEPQQNKHPHKLSVLFLRISLTGAFRSGEPEKSFSGALKNLQGKQNRPWKPVGRFGVDFSTELHIISTKDKLRKLFSNFSRKPWKTSQPQKRPEPCH